MSYELCLNQTNSVFDVKNADWMIQFKIILPPITIDQWYELAGKLNVLSLNESNDKPVSKWTANKQFTIKSVYTELTKIENGPNYKVIWKSKIPEKIKIFMWLVAQGAILSKDNMIKRKWEGNPGCYFFGSAETVDHLLFTYPIAKVVWGIVAMCFHLNIRPCSYEQFWTWIKSALPGGDKIYLFGLAAICWLIWKA
jgi:hypothetical protein